MALGIVQSTQAQTEPGTWGIGGFPLAGKVSWGRVTRLNSSADPIHDQARQTASEIGGAQFVSIPSLSHVAAMSRSDIVLPHVEPFLDKALGR